MIDINETYMGCLVIRKAGPCQVYEMHTEFKIIDRQQGDKGATMLRK